MSETYHLTFEQLQDIIKRTLISGCVSGGLNYAEKTYGKKATPPANWHSFTTPAGYAVKAWNVRDNPAEMYCWVEYGERFYYIGWGGVERSCLGNNDNRGPNQWPIPPAALAALDVLIAEDEAKAKPAPSVVPWSKLEQVPLDHWYRLNDGGGWARIDGIMPDVVRCVFVFGADRSLQELRENFEHSPDGKTWLPCGQVQP
jgi:hypothetical protein